ncbi:BlaI/MecI/CopY family transcriptional regulator [Candidatus Soleaferrea massiliensis]|uniref:BlaI/MecI/CopY family transcriptional regulator n=1 Tax=Candidatus Soleaferrea massiliensis TaxID=1470354 RepID=UPI00058FE80B|nr:BlaI/MecI/CopY family transcriptional regulator [Candidatus Soleaferrea massiliensis]
MNKLKKLPDSEFTVMDVIWDSIPPVTSFSVMEKLGDDKSWKPQTLLTLLSRLTDRGFLRSEKLGKERRYYPLVSRDEYLQFETNSFMSKFHGGSLFSLVNTLHQGKKLDDEEYEEMRKWFQEKG